MKSCLSHKFDRSSLQRRRMRGSQPPTLEQGAIGYCFAAGTEIAKPLWFLKRSLTFFGLCPVVQTERYFSRYLSKYVPMLHLMKWPVIKRKCKDGVSFLPSHRHATVLHEPNRGTRTEEKGTGIEIWYLPLPTIAMVSCNPDSGCHQGQMIFSAALRMFGTGEYEDHEWPELWIIIPSRAVICSLMFMPQLYRFPC